MKQQLLARSVHRANTLGPAIDLHPLLLHLVVSVHEHVGSGVGSGAGSGVGRYLKVKPRTEFGLGAGGGALEAAKPHAGAGISSAPRHKKAVPTKTTFGDFSGW